MYAENMEIVKVGSLRLFKAILDRLEVIDTVNANLRWDQKQWKISPGSIIAAMMMAMFCGRRALFSLNRVYARQDLELLFGRNDLVSGDFNDDCLGRALDRLSEVNALRGSVHFVWAILRENLRSLALPAIMKGMTDDARPHARSKRIHPER